MFRSFHAICFLSFVPLANACRRRRSLGRGNLLHFDFPLEKDGGRPAWRAAAALLIVGHPPLGSQGPPEHDVSCCKRMQTYKLVQLLPIIPEGRPRPFSPVRRRGQRAQRVLLLLLFSNAGPERSRGQGVKVLLLFHGQRRHGRRGGEAPVRRHSRGRVLRRRLLRGVRVMAAVACVGTGKRGSGRRKLTRIHTPAAGAAAVAAAAAAAGAAVVRAVGVVAIRQLAARWLVRWTLARSTGRDNNLQRSLL